MPQGIAREGARLSGPAAGSYSGTCVRTGGYGGASRELSRCGALRESGDAAGQNSMLAPVSPTVTVTSRPM